MLLKSGIKKTEYTNTKQILANVGLQSSVGCIVPSSLATSGKIVKAGTPIKVNLENLSTPVAKADAETAMNAVLLHDVDVTDGNANGTALIFGFVNINRVDSDVASAIATAKTATGVSQLLTFMKA